jgi:hypothetical protein
MVGEVPTMAVGAFVSGSLQAETISTLVPMKWKAHSPFAIMRSKSLAMVDAYTAVLVPATFSTGIPAAMD